MIGCYIGWLQRLLSKLTHAQGVALWLGSGLGMILLALILPAPFPVLCLVAVMLFCVPLMIVHHLDSKRRDR